MTSGGLLALAALAQPCGAQDHPAIAAARSRAASIWPGFDPATVPVLLFDGSRTILSGHPAAPPGFPMAGRHPEVTANSHIELNGVRTATVMPFRDGLTPDGQAGLIAHEMFHVFTSARHPRWVANEVEAFAYPSADWEVLASRRTEYLLLRQALAAPAERRACLSRGALAARHGRYRRMSAGSIGYERDNEMAEGLAEYVERRVAGDPDHAVMPERRIEPEDIRDAVYPVGGGLARLLDHFAAGWRDTLERRDSLRLDVMLAAALTERPGESCALPAGEASRITADARRDVAALQQRRAADLAALARRPGWRVTIVAGAEPLWPQRFDPLNVRLLDSATVLHSRMVRLGNGTGSIEVLGHEAVSRAAGAHPLFNGIRALEITGLPAPPTVAENGGTIELGGDVIRATLRGTVERRESEVVIRLP